MKTHHLGYLTKSTDKYLNKCFGEIKIEKQLYDPIQNSKLTIKK